MDSVWTNEVLNTDIEKSYVSILAEIKPYGCNFILPSKYLGRLMSKEKCWEQYGKDCIYLRKMLSHHYCFCYFFMSLGVPTTWPHKCY